MIIASDCNLWIHSKIQFLSSGTGILVNTGILVLNPVTEDEVAADKFAPEDEFAPTLGWTVKLHNSITKPSVREETDKPRVHTQGKKSTNYENARNNPEVKHH